MPRFLITPAVAKDTWLNDNQMPWDRLMHGYSLGGTPVSEEAFLINWRKRRWPIGGRGHETFFSPLCLGIDCFYPSLWLEDSDRAYHLQIHLCASLSGYFEIQAGCRTWQTFDEAFDHYDPYLYHSVYEDGEALGSGSEHDRKRMIQRLKKAQRLVHKVHQLVEFRND